MKKTAYLTFALLFLLSTITFAQDAPTLSEKKWEFGLQLSSGIGATILSNYSFENGMLNSSEHFSLLVRTTKLGATATRKNIFKKVDLDIHGGLFITGNPFKNAFSESAAYVSILPRFNVNNRFSILAGTTAIIPLTSSAFDPVMMNLSVGIDYKLTERLSINAMYHHSLQKASQYNNTNDHIHTKKFNPGLEIGFKYTFGRKNKKNSFSTAF